MKKIGLLILAVVCFASGVIITFQWQGSKYGMSLHDFFKRPDVVEKIVPVEVVKVLTISDDRNIQIINQEYRDALLKISAVEYTSTSYAEDSIEAMHSYAVKALAVPEEVYKKNPK
jgi:hypothetical protein